MRLWANKRGTTMVEAAVIFPLVIMAVMAVIFILIFLNRQVATQAQMHMNLWADRGEVTETVETARKVNREFPIYRENTKLTDALYYDGVLGFTKRGLLVKNFNKVLQGRIYVVKEVDFIRMTDLILQR